MTVTMNQEFIRQMAGLKDQAVDWSAYQAELQAADDAAKAAEALEAAKVLLEAPDFLDKIPEVLAKRGLAGDPKNAKTLYLDLSSRLLRRPTNRLIQGPSGAGKNYLVDSVLALFPQEAYIQITAPSERAFVFDDTDFRHKAIVIAESAAMRPESPGAVLLRSFAWGDKITYKITEKQASGKHQTRTIVKEGPVALLTTSTRGLDPEMSTRFLTLSIADTVDYTKQIIQETSRQLAGGSTNADVTAFVAAQRWLAVAGTHTVVVPYAGVLASLVAITTVRMRRDFLQLGVAIQTSALIHQRLREKDGQGRVIATRQDYEIAYELVADPLREAQGGLSEAETAVVAAVADLCQDKDPDDGVSRKAIAGAMDLDPEAVRQRLKRPLGLGYVISLRAGEQGKAGLYRPAGGGDVPPPRPVIPTPDALFEKVEAAEGSRKEYSSSSSSDSGSAAAGSAERQVSLDFAKTRPAEKVELADSASAGLRSPEAGSAGPAEQPDLRKTCEILPSAGQKSMFTRASGEPEPAERKEDIKIYSFPPEATLAEILSLDVPIAVDLETSGPHGLPLPWQPGARLECVGFAVGKYRFAFPSSDREGIGRWFKNPEQQDLSEQQLRPPLAAGFRLPDPGRDPRYPLAPQFCQRHRRQRVENAGERRLPRLPAQGQPAVP
jgi:hypothetical protein